MQKLWFVSTEAMPYAKTGGLADVCGSLPGILAQKGFDVSLIMPSYRHLDGPRVDRFTLDLGAERRLVRIEHKNPGDFDVYLVDAPQFFNRDELYGEGESPYPDNARRFIFFSRAALEFINRRGASGIVHAHDWFTGLVPFQVSNSPNFENCRSVFTIHNLQHQGVFSADNFWLTGLPDSCFSPRGVEFYGDLNLMKAGVVGADRITTVSPTYAEEIQTSEFGEGLENVLQNRSSDLTGIVNGIDTESWNCQTDPYLAEDEKFSAGNLSGKSTAKENLLKEYGLKNENNTPLVGTVSRLAEQKGLDLLIKNRKELSRMPAKWIFLGTGSTELEDGLRRWEREFSDSVSAIIDFDEELAHRIVAASDIYCMPSHFEPCGLNQLYCSQYGTVPVVRETGGLADTVEDYRGSGADSGTGFSFREYSGNALTRTLEEAVDLYRNDPDSWKQLRENGFAKDFSWESSADSYIEVYKSIS